MDHCGFFAYRSSDTTTQNIILSTDELGEDVSCAWINFGQDDIVLKKVSYREDDTSIEFIFETQGIQVRFKGKIIVPATETQEYHVLRGQMSVKRGSQKKTFVVYAHSGC